MLGRLPVFVRRACLLLVLAVIFWLSHRPSLRLLPPLFPLQDKVFHVLEFFVLGVTIHMNRDLFPDSGRMAAMAMTGILWGALDEIHQHFVPGRDCSWGDFIADCAGIAIALAVCSRSTGRREKTPLRRNGRGAV